MNPVHDKIPTIYMCKLVDGESTKRGRSRKFLATDELNPEFKDLLDKETQFVVTGKIDGTCCLIRDELLMKRRDIKPKSALPETWVQTGKNTNKEKHLIGFMPVCRDNKEDKWHTSVLLPLGDKEIFHEPMAKTLVLEKGKLCIRYVLLSELEGRTVELCGPKIQGNPHGFPMHCLVPHGMFVLKLPNEALYFEKEPFVKWFNECCGKFEGVVVHFKSGEMFKIHRHHLDLKWMKSNILD